MSITIFEHSEALDACAADIILSLVAAKPDAVLGLATGSTPVGIYEKIIEKRALTNVSFRAVTVFNLDEYAGLPPEHEQSYAYYMKKHLFDRLDIAPERTHIPNGMAADLREEARRYDRMLAASPIDLQLLGLGHNGHIGFNEPGAALHGGTHLTALEPATRRANARFFASEADVPAYAITMGVGAILKAKRILLAVRGADKADILYRSLAGPITTECPASLLQTHADVTVLTDRDAGRRLADVIEADQLAYR